VGVRRVSNKGFQTTSCKHRVLKTLIEHPSQEGFSNILVENPCLLKARILQNIISGFKHPDSHNHFLNQNKGVKHPWSAT